MYLCLHMCVPQPVCGSQITTCRHCSHLHYKGTSDQIEVTGLGGKGHYYPSHFSSPHSHLKTAKSTTTVMDRECYSYGVAVTLINLGVPDGDM